MTTSMGIQPNNIFLLDGGTGTELDRRGVDISLPLWSARAIIDAEDVLKEVHIAYLNAGADAIVTNTFRTHERSLEKAGIGSRSQELTIKAVAIAHDACREVNEDALVFGCVAPLEDCYQPELAPDAATCRKEHSQIISQLVDAGVDLVLLETMSCAHEVLAAIDAAEEITPGHWAVSLCLCEQEPVGVLLDGTPLHTFSDSFKGARFVGINCVAAPTLSEQVSHLNNLLDDDVDIAAYGNVGYADSKVGWINTDAIEPERYASYALQWIDSGATIVGGCCGTTPETISAIHQQLKIRST